MKNQQNETNTEILLKEIQKTIELLLVSTRAQIDTSKYIKTPNGLYLTGKTWDNISDARNVYFNTITDEIDKLLKESNSENKKNINRNS